MLQKVLVVLIGLVMSLVSAVSPTGGMFASKQEGASPLDAATEQTLATIRAGSGEAFARVSVLWVEVDGRRVEEDAWGTGRVEEMRFKVGVKGVEGAAISVGDKVVDLHPTDVITIRTFQGDYSYRGVGTPLATIQLQGHVKATELSGGVAGNKVRTERDPLAALPGPAQPVVKETGPIAYVVLDTGKQVDTVARVSGGSRMFTEAAPVASQAQQKPGALMAKWIKVDGRAIRDPLSGDGVVDRIEFEPQPEAQGVVLSYNGGTTEALPGERVVITDFVGSYSISPAAKGGYVVRLDGYSGSLLTTNALPLPTAGGAGAPIVSFDFTPAVARTIDTVQFTDRSRDEDGVILLWQWDFGDNSTSILQHPTHTYAKPGVYDVTLNVTDNDMKASQISRKITVLNTEPIPDFTWAPTRVSSDTLVAFADRSTDPDGAVVSWHWDMGDGTTNTTRNPTHQYATSGNKTVTLTVTDDRGATAKLSKVLNVLNTPPTGAFTYTFHEEGTDVLDPVLKFEGGSPASLVPVFFHDASTDRDGTIVSWEWSFGDGGRASGSEVSYKFPRPGLFTVSLTVTDNLGESTTVSKQLVVRNRAPLPDFAYTPDGAAIGATVTFTSTSRDVDGLILATRWDFGDGTAPSLGPTATHTFNRSGVFNVTLTVTDSALATSTVSKPYSVANAIPHAAFLMMPNPAYRNTTVTFTDASTDADGDRIVSRHWEFGGGDVANGVSVQRAFSTLGTRIIKLTVTDSAGNTGWTTQSLSIVNRPPVGTFTITPLPAIANRPVWFNATGADTDGDGPVTFEWIFSDTTAVYTGASVRREFPEGSYTVRLRTIDNEGGRSLTQVQRFDVTYAVPEARFDRSVAVPTEGETVTFLDRSSSGNGVIKSWSWAFSDQTTSSRQNPPKVFATGGDYTVELTVVDEQDRVSMPHREAIWVNKRPEVRFEAPGATVPLFHDIPFQDDSIEHDKDDAIQSWRWDFGDGTTSNERNPVHRFETPGMKVVRLTVTDRYNATNSTTKVLTIANSRPIANWHTEGILKANSDIRFVSYPDSMDPDDPVGAPRGASIRSFLWDLGDRGITSDQPNVTHRFPRSGSYLVNLTVGDGELTSLETAQSKRYVRVAANHDVPVRVTATLPGNRVASLDDPRFLVEIVVGNGGAARTYRTYTMDGPDAIFRLPAGTWSAGEPVVARLRDVGHGGPMLLQFTTLTEESGLSVEERLAFKIPLALAPQVTVAGGEEPGMLDHIFPRRESVNGDALHTSFVEDFNGTGRAPFADGYAVSGVEIVVEARYVPARTAAPVRDILSSQTRGGPPDTLIGWCKVDEAVTDATGAFTWRMDGGSQDCWIDGGFHPAGRWEFRAIATYPDAAKGTSPARTAYVDPTGGLLFSTAFALV